MGLYKINHLRQIEHVKSAMRFLVTDRVFDSLPLKLIRSWIFQGALYMERGEQLFRVSVEVLLTATIIVILHSLSVTNYILWGVVLGHSTLWLFNGHFWALQLRDGRRLGINKPAKVLNYLGALSARVQRSVNIDGCVIFGSLARDSFNANSDLDIVLMPRDGLWSSVAAYWFAMRERLLGFINRTPIELYVYKKKLFLSISEKEHPVLIKDSSGSLSQRIPEAIEYQSYPFKSQTFFRSTGKGG